AAAVGQRQRQLWHGSDDRHTNSYTHGNAQFYTYTNGNATAADSYTDSVTDNYTDADCYAKSYSEASSDTTSTPYSTRLRAWRVNIKVLKSLKLISTVTMYE